jgi:hypothetical protein
VYVGLSPTDPVNSTKEPLLIFTVTPLVDPAAVALIGLTLTFLDPTADFTYTDAVYVVDAVAVYEY